ncbi:hypothetical protein GE21DRAFT_4965 [Neurospora crassa]|uniref:Uncharacterized protein n=1 Tax=Neurospora crassa (strain ATCC 24698 / 74-OR23-1A / CBS 708.71 / DSM 1257 / FGSC 987) TaxID=367110 RepID=Q7S1A2_NEUCR|nr:hypothetical protein NCU07518 [Neurospora crassa OR74A]EAA29130.3 hypothetical protein NCU07518 [Neurospora crassa OR74A]KHE80152.1 hypothetical protein GE21DRAFT_4965 [Neurospora crassa]|eukprot:XP_958366.3 hypothetical protein NCU07518 [Neurospora crassa OR74A]
MEAGAAFFLKLEGSMLDRRLGCFSRASSGLDLQDVVTSCHGLGGLDVIKAESALYGCDAAKPISTSISDCVVITFSTVVPSNTDSVPGPVPPARIVRRAGSAHLSLLPSPSAPVLLLRRPPLTIVVDVPGAREASMINDVPFSVETLCKCDFAKPALTECGSRPGPTGGSSADPITTTSAPVPGRGYGGGSNPSSSGSSHCPAAISVPGGHCGTDNWVCAEQFKAIFQCAVSFIQDASVSVGCKKGEQGGDSRSCLSHVLSG